MIKRIDFGAIRFAFTLNAVVKVYGVNSYVGEDEHILMWDFDDVKLSDVTFALRKTQLHWKLPKIYVFETKKDCNYCAYCFYRVKWQNAIAILASTPYVDMKYLKWSVYRGRFTLRVSPKMDRIPHIRCPILSAIPENATVDDLKSWTVYETVGGKEWLQNAKNKCLETLGLKKKSSESKLISVRSAVESLIH